MSTWDEIAVPAAVACIDDVAATLVDEVPEAAQGVQIRSDEIVFWVDRDIATQVAARVTDVCRRLADGGMAVRWKDIEVSPGAPEEEWRDAWKKYFKVTALSRQLIVVPSWETYEPKPGERIIHLDPGQAFGTGTHATTRLMLEHIQCVFDEQFSVARFADIGAGSGILSIACCLLWPAATGEATDLDPLAVSAVTENALANAVHDRIHASHATPDSLGGPQELVLANIQANVLITLAAVIAPQVAPGGILLLSGVLAGQAALVVEAFAAAGLTPISTTQDDASDWVCIRLHHNG